jgi:outer membrane protein OmpA-like peptidoglycan-associated protein
VRAWCLALLVALAGCGDKADQRAPLEGVVFAPDSTTLPDGAGPALDQLVATLTAEPALAIRIEGYVAASGSGGNDRTLSALQTVTIRKYLVAHGIDATRIHMQGMGAGTPPRIEIVRL